MTRIIIVFFILMGFSVDVYAGSINAAAYQTMKASSYRNNYNRHVQSGAMPYWQAQSNYTTRNRMYNNYQNYVRYNNSVNQYNYNTRMQRSRY